MVVVVVEVVVNRNSVVNSGVLVEPNRVRFVYGRSVEWFK